MPARNGPDNYMDLRSGTPLWATILVALVTLLGSHLLTVYREGKKSRQDREKAWLLSCKDLIREIVDDAISHYCDSTSLGSSTDLSAAKINHNLKRLSTLARELTAADGSHSAELARLLRSLRHMITSPVEYQTPDRALKRSDDPLFEEIASCEHSLIANLKKPRK